MKRYLDYIWPIVGLVAVIWSVELLWEKLKAEALTRVRRPDLWAARQHPPHDPRSDQKPPAPPKSTTTG